MPRLISVALTEDAVVRRAKTVTRRLGWLNLRPGTRLSLVRKAMGRRRRDGSLEPLVYLGEVEVVAVRRERLDAVDAADVAREGFPDWTPAEFVAFFTSHMRCPADTEVTVITWKYIRTVTARGADPA
jgi:hypothetical protein